MYDIVSIGEALIDMAAGESNVPLSEVKTFKRVAGGAPANVAIGASKLGSKAAFITRVGDEAFGKHIIDTISRYGVDTTGIQVDPEVKTALAFFALPTPYTREFLFYRNPGADMMISFDEIPPEYLNSCRIFHHGSISLISGPAAETTIKAVETAKAGGALISYDPNLRMSLWPDERTARSTIMSAVKYADIIKVNEEEMEFLFEDPDLDKGIERLLGMGPSVVLCTKGEFGSIYATEKIRGSRDIVRLESVDSVGCGDSYLSGILVNLCAHSLEEIVSNPAILDRAVSFGAAAAAITSTERGVTDALPTAEQVEKLLEKLD